MKSYYDYNEKFINSQFFKEAKVPLLIGLDDNDEIVMEDLIKIGNIFIAGLKGSGKTVFLQGLITTLIKNRTPQEVRLLMINRTEEETEIYKDIPHLGMPPVSNPIMTGQILNYLRDEMERRYVYFARNNVKNIVKYNEIMKRDGKEDKALPYIVLFIEEANNMLLQAKSINALNDFAAISMKATEAGIHFIVATNSISSGFITTQAHSTFFPNRIAFNLGDDADYERILGRKMERAKATDPGEMYYFKHQSSSPRKLSTLYLSLDEVSEAIQSVSTSYAPSTLRSIFRSKKENLTDELQKKCYYLIDENARLTKDNKALMLELAKTQKELLSLKDKLKKLQ